MKFTLAIGALVASASAVNVAPNFPAHMDRRQAGGFNTGSALGVLGTALPPSLLSLALTNSNAASSQIASEFAAGQTPSWFSGLPSDIQTYLVPAVPTPTAAGGASVLSSAASSLSSVAGITPRPSVGMSMPYGTNGTAAMSGVAGMGSGTAGGASTTSGSGSSGSSSSSGSMSTGGSGSGSGSSGSGSSGSSGSGANGGSSSSSAAGVPAQTAALGMGIAGVAAAVGILAL